MIFDVKFTKNSLAKFAYPFKDPRHSFVFAFKPLDIVIKDVIVVF